MKHLIWDTEILGSINPVYLLRAYCPEEDVHYKFWFDKRGHMDKLWALLNNPSYLWVGFNSIKFDSVITSGIMWGMDTHDLKEVTSKVIQQRLQPFQIYRKGAHEAPPIDWPDSNGLSRHIDIFEVAPGVKTSLKIYMARMHAETLQDLPYHHNDEIDTPKKRKVVEEYCGNDIAGTLALFNALKAELELRQHLSEEFGMDLRSKSDAQMAEAIFKKKLNLPKASRPQKEVFYELPTHLIKTKNSMLLDLIAQTEQHAFEINDKNGSPIQPAWMKDGIVGINNGRYKYGLGGLHSAHDVKLYAEATDEVFISDFDVASYYPNIIVKCGFIPRMNGNKGDAFIELYEAFLARRMEAKKTGNKNDANSLKILLNGTFGKLGSMFSVLYAPELLLGVTITGQLNLLCLIDELEKIKGVSVLSANTDGLMVKFGPATRDKVLGVFNKNAKRTGFEYEETPYSKIALRDVNNYIAIKPDGSVKGKGVHADVDSKPDPLKTHRSFTICSIAAVAYIKDGTPVAETINACADIRQFVSMANGDGQSGGIQTVTLGTFDEWSLSEDRPGYWVNHIGGSIKRKSRPSPYEAPVAGSETKIGRIVRWYISSDPSVPAIRTVKGNRQVPLTEGGRVCMVLPTKIPNDLDRQWYINHTTAMLDSMGVTIS